MEGSGTVVQPFIIVVIVLLIVIIILSGIVIFHYDNYSQRKPYNSYPTN